MPFPILQDLPPDGKTASREKKENSFSHIYYDNRIKGEIDYLIDDYDILSAVPIEVKSGKDYTVKTMI